MHLPRHIGPVSYRVSQNNPGVSSTLAFVALQHPSCPTHSYHRHKAAVPVMVRLQRKHLPPFSAAACLGLPVPLPTRRLASVSAEKMSGVVSSLFAAIKLRMLSSIPKTVPPFQRTVPVDARILESLSLVIGLGSAYDVR